MLFAARQARLAFILNVTLHPDKTIRTAVAGHAEAAHEQGCRDMRRAVSVPRAEAEIVITGNGGYPLDQNLYQAVKGMTAAEACCVPGGPSSWWQAVATVRRANLFPRTGRGPKSCETAGGGVARTASPHPARPVGVSNSRPYPQPTPRDSGDRPLGRRRDPGSAHHARRFAGRGTGARLARARDFSADHRDP